MDDGLTDEHDGPIRCAFCGAAPDQPCRTSDGRILDGLHVSRFGRGPDPVASP
jgi:hypothetical protein